MGKISYFHCLRFVGQLNHVCAGKHIFVEIIKVRSSDKRLASPLHRLHQCLSAPAVQLTHHIIKKKHGLLIEDFLDHCRLGELVGEHNGTLLALTRIQRGVLSVKEKGDSVGVGANKSAGTTTLLGRARLERRR